VRRRSECWRWCLLWSLTLLAVPVSIAAGSSAPVDEAVTGIAPKVRSWRRDLHRHPELGNHEVRTAALVAAHLRALGLDEVHTGIAHTGVLGVLKGSHPGAVVALRADMDALPIREATELPFASRVVVDVDGVPTPVMHACGHDAHTAMLMGAAEVLAGLRDSIAGTVLFVFQPAEEGVASETAGAALMLQEGVFARWRPQAILALHVEPGPVGQIQVRPGPFLSGATSLRIALSGQQSHAGRPWDGTDLINLSADIVKSLTTISARRLDLFSFPNVVSIGAVQAGNRGNILPGQALLHGTIRAFDIGQRERLKQLIGESVAALSSSYGAQAQVQFQDDALVTVNDPALLARLMPALAAASGAAGVLDNASQRGAAEDFSFFSEQIPGLYYILGSSPTLSGKADPPGNHSDRFDIDESVLAIGVKAHVLTTLQLLGEAMPPSD
jgi:amidohydrolase